VIDRLRAQFARFIQGVQGFIQGLFTRVVFFKWFLMVRFLVLFFFLLEFVGGRKKPDGGGGGTKQKTNKNGIVQGNWGRCHRLRFFLN